MPDLAARAVSENDIPEFIGHSESFEQIRESIRQVADTQMTVLITGESGTGKEVVARALHTLSSRRDRPLITVNCGAIPEGILESELFGHEKGSFTGAVETRKGYFELADGGTLLLDEIGEMPLPTQVKLLRVLEEKEFMRVGGTRMIHVDVRVLASTNRNLEKAVKQNEFRKDLFYRLNAVKIHIPPLRERREDIRPLAEHFLDEICAGNKIQCQGFTEDGIHFLESQSWPGNARELRNLLERVIILEKGHRIDRETLEKHMTVSEFPESQLPVPMYRSADQAERELLYRALLDIRMAVDELRNLILDIKSARSSPGTYVPVSAEIPSEKDFLIKELEKNAIIRALSHFEGNRRQAAQALGIGNRTLYRKLKEYGIE